MFSRKSVFVLLRSAQEAGVVELSMVQLFATPRTRTTRSVREWLCTRKFSKTSFWFLNTFSDSSNLLKKYPSTFHSSSQDRIFFYVFRYAIDFSVLDCSFVPSSPVSTFCWECQSLTWISVCGYSFWFCLQQQVLGSEPPALVSCFFHPPLACIAATTEATTAASTKETTEATTEATTQSTTEATTQSTTDATTQSTTDATTQSTSDATTQSTTETSTDATTGHCLLDPECNIRIHFQLNWSVQLDAHFKFLPAVILTFCGSSFNVLKCMHCFTARNEHFFEDTKNFAFDSHSKCLLATSTSVCLFPPWIRYVDERAKNNFPCVFRWFWCLVCPHSARSHNL